MTGRERFGKRKTVILILVKVFSLLPQAVLIFFWDCISRNSQILFVGLRYVILKCLSKSCGDNIKIGTNVQILGWKNLSLGDNVSIHSNCYIDANGGITIKNNVSIAHNSTVLSSNHTWDDLSCPIKYNPLKFASVTIDDDVWIGCGVRILAGVNIGKRSIVAAGAVVNREIEHGSIMGGIPAKLIKRI